MKLLTTIAVFVSLCSFGQTFHHVEDASLQQSGIKARVKSILSNEYSAVSCKDSSYVFFVYDFLSGCNYSQYDKNGNITQKIIFDYNDNDSTFSIAERWRFQYKFGKLSSEINISGSDSVRYDYAYRENLVSCITNNPNGGSWKLERNKNKAVMSYYDNGEEYPAQWFFYDKNNRLIRLEEYQKLPDDKRFKLYSYYKNAKIETETTVDFHSAAFHTYFKYDRNGNLKELIANNKLLYTYEYVYDKQKNWVERTRYYNGKIENITTRKIVYF